MEVSYTLLKTYLDCPFSYYLRYVRRIPIRETSASVYGSVVHRAIKMGYENDLGRDDWIKVFKAEWASTTYAKDDIVYLDDRDYLRKLKSGQKVIANYYDSFVDGKPAPLVVEHFFGRNAGVTIGNHVIIGVFDQIDLEERVIDYKTGAKPTNEQLDLDLQFTIYSYAYRELYGKEEKSLVLRHLSSCKDIVTSRSSSDFKVLASEIDKVERAIDAKIFVRNMSRGCATCYFLETCLKKQRPVYVRKWKSGSSSK